MASKPGILTEWPWAPLGNLKVYSFYYLWKYRTAKGNNRIVDKSIEFDQVDRESNCCDHPFAELLVYYTLFAIPVFTTLFIGTASIASIGAYAICLDFMTPMGHCNFELIPKWMFSVFPPLKYLMYTPSYHSLHHTQFRTNYSLFMPMYDYIYDTVDKSSDILYEKSLEREVEVPDVVHLTHEEQLNSNGEFYIKRYPHLKVKVVHGSSLVVVVVLKTISKGTSQVVFRGRLSKVANNIALALCQGGIQVITLDEEDYKRLKAKLIPETWLVGEGLSEDEQLKAPKGTLFIPFSQFQPRKARKDCLYFNTPAMIAPKHLANVDSCENWLPRRVMSAGRIAGILHALEGWNVHDCGDMMLDIEKVWKASLVHGFCPLTKISTA
ncbi:hypothetical protein HAX54_050457 [Datura stramonium]|uniref:Uncharacterized protein n=1 Tax=Datura stramonium TaxID=4076 RepID=A0ABS8SWG8_DATST|nr:hypothetical protein [Datura stramonium]